MISNSLPSLHFSKNPSIGCLFSRLKNSSGFPVLNFDACSLNEDLQAILNDWTPTSVKL